MGVMFSVHKDSVWSMLPPRTFSVGFEEQIVVGVMFFTFTDPKIVVKKIVISDFVLFNGREGVKIWGLLFFGYSQKFLSELVSLYSPQTPVSSM